MNAILVDGVAIVALADGEVDPPEKEGGAMGINIPRLGHHLAQLAKLQPPKRLDIAFDARLPYKLLIQVLFSAKQKDVGYREFGVLARANGNVVMVPLTLPDKAPPDPKGKMVLAPSQTEAIVWSTDGSAGTLQAPELRVKLTDASHHSGSAPRSRPS